MSADAWVACQLSSAPASPCHHAVRRLVCEPPARHAPSGAALLQQIFEVDPLACPTCHEPTRIIACITQPSVIDQILTHRRRATTAAPGGARSPHRPGRARLGARRARRVTRRRPARPLTALRRPRLTGRGRAAYAGVQAQPRMGLPPRPGRRPTRRTGARASRPPDFASGRASPGPARARLARSGAAGLDHPHSAPHPRPARRSRQRCPRPRRSPRGARGASRKISWRSAPFRIRRAQPTAKTCGAFAGSDPYLGHSTISPDGSRSRVVGHARAARGTPEADTGPARSRKARRTTGSGSRPSSSFICWWRLLAAPPRLAGAIRGAISCTLFRSPGPSNPCMYSGAHRRDACGPAPRRRGPSTPPTPAQPPRAASRGGSSGKTSHPADKYLAAWCRHYRPFLFSLTEAYAESLDMNMGRIECR